MTTGLAEVEATVTLELHLPEETAAIVSRVKIGEVVFERVTEPTVAITEQDVLDRLRLDQERVEVERNLPPMKGGKRGTEPLSITCRSCRIPFVWKPIRGRMPELCPECKGKRGEAKRKKPAPCHPWRKDQKPKFGAKGAKPDSDGKAVKARTRLLEEAAVNAREGL